jgi:predicted nucleic acid-binding protein
MSVDLALIDTNVFVYSLYQHYADHVAARALVDRANSENAGLCTAAQVLAEFFSTVTNPRRVSVPRTRDEAVDDISIILASPGLTLLPTPHDVIAGWSDLVRRYKVTGSDVFDAQIAAIMLASGVKKIFTFNESDFRRFDELDVLRP